MANINEEKFLQGIRIELSDGTIFYAPKTTATQVLGLTDVVDARVSDLGGIVSQDEMDALKESVDAANSYKDTVLAEVNTMTEEVKDDIIAIQNDLLTKGTDIEALDTRITNNETVIEEIGSDIDSIDEDIEDIQNDIAKIKTDFMETSDYLEGGEFKDIYLSTVIDRIDTLESTPGTDVDEVQGLIDASIAGIVDSSPEALDTLKELADALGNDANFSTTVTELIGTKLSTEDAADTYADKSKENTFTEQQTLEGGLKVIGENGICIEADGAPDLCTNIHGYTNGSGADESYSTEVSMMGDWNFDTNGHKVLIDGEEIGAGGDAGFFKFEVEDGDLILYSSADETPDFEIDGDNLYVTI